MSDDFAAAYGKLVREHQQLIDAVKRHNGTYYLPIHVPYCEWWSNHEHIARRRGLPCTCGAADLRRIVWGTDA